MAKEHSIFISYRQLDGSELATWIFGKINGTSINISNEERVVLTCQIDLAIPGRTNWKKYLNKELKQADTLIIVCSPAGMSKYFDRPDYYYHELEWWITNRKKRAPILVSIKEHGHQCVPFPILYCWKNLQVAQINSRLIKKVKFGDSNKYVDIFLESISRGIRDPLGYVGSNISFPPMMPPLPNIEGVFAWEKDRHGKYIYANELYARAAGVDSPYSMLGKTDDEMPWRTLAEKFREGDRMIMTGNELSRLAVLEKEIMAEKMADILVNEGVIRDHSNRIIGVRGCFIDVTKLSHLIKPKMEMDETGIYLGSQFDNEHLDKTELQVLKGLIYLIPKEKIALLESRSLKEIKSAIASLKRKFQCSRESDILATAIRAGVPLDLLLVNLPLKSK